MAANDDLSGASVSLSFRLRWVAIALFGAYLFSVVAESLPLRLADLNWRLNVATTLVDNATIPLIGLGIAHLAVYLDPDNPAALVLRRRVSRLAALASLGFLLIIPLQIGSSVSLYADLAASRFQQINKADQRLVQLAAAIQASPTVDKLESTLLVLQGSALSDNDRAQSLDTIKRLLLDRIREARKVLQERRRQLAVAAPLNPSLLVRRSFRIVLTSLVFALAYAAGSELPNSPLSLLEHWQISRLRILEWWVELREQRQARQAEREELRQERERMAALEALRRQRLTETLEQQDQEVDPWYPPDPRSDLDYYRMIMVEDPAGGTGSDPQPQTFRPENASQVDPTPPKPSLPPDSPPPPPPTSTSGPAAPPPPPSRPA